VYVQEAFYLYFYTGIIKRWARLPGHTVSFVFTQIVVWEGGGGKLSQSTQKLVKSDCVLTSITLLSYVTQSAPDPLQYK